MQLMKMAFHKLAEYMSKRRPAIAVLLYLLLPPLPAAAASLEVKLPTGITVYAEYHRGLPSMPAVLLLHGFQQIHQSEPMNSLGSNLASKGYTVLIPTISLGVNKRRQSMACEAVHTYTYKEEVAEIAYWMNWLDNKGYKTIIPAGFSSTGNVGLLIYNAQVSHPAVKKIILVSPNPTFFDLAERQKIRTAMNTKQTASRKKLGAFTLGYCKKNYFATAANYQSYTQYDESKFVELIRQSPVPAELILGSADTILPAAWLTQLKVLKAPARTTIIDQANHFFADTAEFDLTDAVENIIKNINTQ
jgi:esterase/lipase